MHNPTDEEYERLYDDDMQYEYMRDMAGETLYKGIRLIFDKLVIEGEYKYYKNNPDKFEEHATIELKEIIKRYKQEVERNEKAKNTNQ